MPDFHILHCMHFYLCILLCEGGEVFETLGELLEKVQGVFLMETTLFLNNCATTKPILIKFCVVRLNCLRRWNTLPFEAFTAVPSLHCRLRLTLHRPSLPFEERQRRRLLVEVTKVRNGPEPEKENRFLVWLNPRTEKYELRQIKDGEWTKFSKEDQATDEDLEAAADEIEMQRKQQSEQHTGKLVSSKVSSLNSQ